MLMLFGYEFSLIALIGLILLIGLVKKNGIMMVDFALAAERDEHLTTEQAIRKAAMLRFRPIMMTTMAAMLGGVPLMLGQGTGSELRQPLGYAMVGGLHRQPGADPIHDAGDLSLSRPALQLAVARGAGDRKASSRRKEAGPPSRRETRREAAGVEAGWRGLSERGACRIAAASVPSSR